MSPEVVIAIQNFMDIDHKSNIIEKIERLIETSVKNGVVEEWGLVNEIGMLFDLKRLIQALPETVH